MREAAKIANVVKVPKRDALHAVIARDNSAVMVATDKHFDKLQFVVETKHPKDIY